MMTTTGGWVAPLEWSLSTIRTNATAVIGEQNNIWQDWNANMRNLGTAATTAAVTFQQYIPTSTWVWTDTIQTSITWTGWNNAYNVHMLTEEERAARDAERIRRQEEWRAREIERMAVEQAMRAKAVAERVASDARARELLHALLSPQQKRDLLEHGWFEVIGRSGKRWRIRQGNLVGNVDLMPEQGDERLASYCAHPPGYEGLPTDDHHIAQMLSLQDDDQAFVDVSYLHYRKQGLEVPVPRDPVRRIA
jgi:hypothetical protein